MKRPLAEQRRLEAEQRRIKEQAIHCIAAGSYDKATEFIFDVIAVMVKLGTLRPQGRSLRPSQVKKMIETEYENRRSRYSALSMGITRKELAREVYSAIMLELAPESTNHRPLSEQLEDEER
jgi:hypothetical protein